jgi:formamidopyrimidine-DNA glycosylase
MPERPDLEYVVPILVRELVGRSVVGAAVRKPVVLRCLADEIRGEVRGVVRRAHAVDIDLGARHLVVLPMLAGRFELAPPTQRVSADTALVLTLSDGRELRYRDDVQMGKVWLTAPGAPVPGLAEGGVDVLGPDFTLDRLRALAKGRRDQVKVFLMDRTALDAFGNAYADEALFAAGLHPKRLVSRLSPGELDRLHAALVATLRDARDTVRARAPALPEKVRDFLRVRGRKGDRCSTCGATIRVAGIHGHDAYFCPECQPDTEGKGLADWRRSP